MKQDTKTNISLSIIRSPVYPVQVKQDPVRTKCLRAGLERELGEEGAENDITQKWRVEEKL